MLEKQKTVRARKALSALEDQNKLGPITKYNLVQNTYNHYTLSQFT